MVSIFIDVSNKSSPFLGSLEADIERVSQTAPGWVLINMRICVQQEALDMCGV